MIFGKASVKKAVKAIDGSNYTPAFVEYQSLIWEHLIDFKYERSVHRFGSHFVHNVRANVAPLAEYTGQRNYHKKEFTTQRLTDRASDFFSQLTAITPPSYTITR